MKYTIEGFQQEELIRMGLDSVDAIILRYIVDFYLTSGMKKRMIDGEPYVWIYYQAVIEAVPIIRIKKQALADRFKKYIQCGLMKHKTIKEKGTFSYYRINPDMLHRLVAAPAHGWVQGRGA